MDYLDVYMETFYFFSNISKNDLLKVPYELFEEIKKLCHLEEKENLKRLNEIKNIDFDKFSDEAKQLIFYICYNYILNEEERRIIEDDINKRNKEEFYKIHSKNIFDKNIDKKEDNNVEMIMEDFRNIENNKLAIQYDNPFIELLYDIKQAFSKFIHRLKR